MITLPLLTENPLTRSAAFSLEDAVWKTRQKNIKSESSGTFEKISYPESSYVLCWMNVEENPYPPHWHPAVEIILPIEGCYRITTNRTSYQAEENECLIIPSAMLHQTASPGKGMRLIILVDGKFFSNIRGFFGTMQHLSAPLHLKMSLNPQFFSMCRDILLSILDHYISEPPLWDLSIQSLLMQFFIAVSRNTLMEQTPGKKSGRHQIYLQKLNAVFEYIENHYSRDLRLEEAAAIAGFSKFHFSRIFGGFTNQTFYDYINARRIRTAEALLINLEMPITEIAYASGFSSITTFNRVFKQIKGCTPSKFREYYSPDFTLK